MEFDAASERENNLKTNLSRAWVLLIIGVAILTPSHTSTGHQMTAAKRVLHKGDGIRNTGLRPVLPKNFSCPPIKSLYASWLDVDGTRRATRHSGVDAGNFGDTIIAPAPGRVEQAWVADWSWGAEGALLISHSQKDLNLTFGPPYYYSAFYHLRPTDLDGLKQGQNVKRGQKLGRVFVPGGNESYLPEVHLETYEVYQMNALRWSRNKFGRDFWQNTEAKLIDPLYLLSLENKSDGKKNVLIEPFEIGRDYSKFRGFTYFLTCIRK